MAIQNEPTRITIPFAASGTKNTIPDNQPSPSASQAASWTDGFPAQCSLPLSAGGIPPARADFNGIFNAITQSERFTQEGGVWLWSNAVDYAASRMARGSDGKLYWSAAQSGPNVGGAVDPTTDDGTYWVKLPSMTDIAAQGFATQSWVTNQNYATQTWVGNQGFATQTWVGNQGYATQTWVGNQGFATQTWVSNKVDPFPIYVDPQNGNDTNDGLSQSTAVQHISQAIALANNRLGSPHTIYLAGATYTENVSIQISTPVVFSLLGSVIISGTFYVNNSSVYISESNYSLTVTLSSSATAIRVDNRSIFDCGVPLVVNGYGTTSPTDPASNQCILIDHLSYALFRKETSCTLNAGRLSSGLGVGNCSFAVFVSTIYILGSESATTGISVGYCSSCYLSTVDMTNITTLSFGISITSQSFASISGNATWRGSSSAIFVSNGSELSLNGTNWAYSDANGVCVKADGLSSISIGGNLNINGSDLEFAIMCVNCSVMSIYNAGATLSFTGSAKANDGATIKLSVSSFVFLNNQISISGTFSSPYKYVVGECSMFASNGIASYIPGTSTNLKTSTYGVMN